MSDFIKDIITTLTGVLAGGLLTIWVNNIDNKKRLLLQIEVSLLSELKPLLALSIKEMRRKIDIARQVLYTKAEELYSLNLKDVVFEEVLDIFTSNSFIFGEFSYNFQSIYERKAELDLELEKIIDKEVNIVAYGLERGETDSMQEVDKRLKNIEKRYLTIIDDLNSFISELDQHYLSKIYKRK